MEVTYLTWTAFIFTWLIQFLWWEFRWSKLTSEIGIGLFLFLVLYAVSLFSLAVILVPDRLSIVDDSWKYFLSIRVWFYGGLLVVNSIDLMDTFLKGADWWLRTGYLSYWVALTASAVIGLIATRRSLHTGLGITMLLWNNALTFYDSEILGG